MTMRIVTGGLQTTVQDLGRIGHQRDGVPAGGAMDRMALRVANLLVGNDENAACLEAALIGPAITFEQPSLIAITGGDFNAAINATDVPPWHAVYVQAGATLRFGHPRTGCRVYIAVAGGIDVPQVFGSRSTYLRASFGGYEGRALRSGDVLHFGTTEPRARRTSNGYTTAFVNGSPGSAATAARWTVSHSLRPPYSDDPIIRIVAGAHLDALDEASRERIASATFRVSSTSDRMGYRLEGVKLALSAPIELLSEAVAFGTVQLPPGGDPIILMADRATTGGYPRLGEVASVDLPLIAQLKPGDRLRFRFVTIEDAQRALLGRELEIAQARAAISLLRSRELS